MHVGFLGRDPAEVLQPWQAAVLDDEVQIGEVRRDVVDVGDVTLGDLPDDKATTALHERRQALGLSTASDDLVLVDHLGQSYEPDAVPMALRKARSTRISIDGNAHFCRGLLRTRYGDEPPAFVALQASPSPVSKKGTRS